MPNDFGNIDKASVISQLIVEDFDTAIMALKVFSFDADAGDFRSEGESVTVHLYETEADGSLVQDISGGSISYASDTTDVTLTPVAVNLFKRVRNGFTLPELVYNRSSAEDLYNKLIGKKVRKAAKEMLQDVCGVITVGNFASNVAASTYTFAKHMDVLKAGFDKDWTEGSFSVVLGNAAFTELLNSLTALPGVNVTEAMQTGVLKNLAGVDVIRSAIVPADTRGFACTPDAVAVAIRPLAALQSGMSYGESGIASLENGVAMRYRKWQSPNDGAMNYVADSIYGKSKFNGDALIRITAS